jgi:hypothetical protein
MRCNVWRGREEEAERAGLSGCKREGPGGLLFSSVFGLVGAGEGQGVQAAAGLKGGSPPRWRLAACQASHMADVRPAPHAARGRAGSSGAASPSDQGGQRRGRLGARGRVGGAGAQRLAVWGAAGPQASSRRRERDMQNHFPFLTRAARCAAARPASLTRPL